MYGSSTAMYGSSHNGRRRGEWSTQQALHSPHQQSNTSSTRTAHLRARHVTTLTLELPSFPCCVHILLLRYRHSLVLALHRAATVYVSRC